MTKEQTRLERLFIRIETRFPRVAMFIHRLRQPRARLIRIPLGIFLVIGGIFSFLPVLGLWMLPLGLLLLAVDLPFLQRPLNGTVISGQRRWSLWRRARRDAAGKRTPPSSGLHPDS